MENPVSLFEAMKNVYQTPENSVGWIHIETLMDSFGLDQGYERATAEQEATEGQFTSYWLQKHLCTDTWVGKQVVFFEDEVVALISQSARKSDKMVYWVPDQMEKMLKVLTSLIRTQYKSRALNLKDLPEQIPPVFNVNWSGELLDKKGYCYGMPCTVTNTRPGEEGEQVFDLHQMVEVEFESGLKEVVRVQEFDVLVYSTVSENCYPQEGITS